MSVIFLLIPLSVVLATAFLGAFIWAVRSGQYEDTCTPSMRLLLDDPPPAAKRADISLQQDKLVDEQ
jgi:cbb3-type cytochrome oxidase maturation protein